MSIQGCETGTDAPCEPTTPVRVIAPTLAARTQSRQHIDRSKQISHCVSFFFWKKSLTCSRRSHSCQDLQIEAAGSREAKNYHVDVSEDAARSSGRCSSKHSTWRLTMPCAQATSPLTSVASGAVPVPERTDMSSSRL